MEALLFLYELLLETRYYLSHGDIHLIDPSPCQSYPLQNETTTYLSSLDFLVCQQLCTFLDPIVQDPLGDEVGVIGGHSIQDVCLESSASLRAI